MSFLPGVAFWGIEIGYDTLCTALYSTEILRYALELGEVVFAEEEVLLIIIVGGIGVGYESLRHHLLERLDQN